MLGLVAFYDIRPGNGAGLFVQPRSPRGATALIAKYPDGTPVRRSEIYSAYIHSEVRGCGDKGKLITVGTGLCA